MLLADSIDQFQFSAFLLLLADLLIRVGLSIRVIMRRLPTGSTLAWLAPILVIPFAGALAYLLIGERRLGRVRRMREIALEKPFARWRDGLESPNRIEWDALPVAAIQLSRQAESSLHIPPLPGGAFELFDDAETALRRLAADIDSAREVVHLEFYIWENGGVADEVADALRRAALRGVTCRVLVDALGARPFLTSATHQRLRAAGVRIVASLPYSVARLAFVRADLRNHRKIAVIDGRIAYTGSMNLVDPRYFKQNENVGQWIDILARVLGPPVEPLNLLFLGDWQLETGEDVAALADSTFGAPPDAGKACAQLVPSGPGQRGSVIHEVIISACFAATERLTLTTPYFVPDDAVLTALVAAANRGVRVELIVPRDVDSRLVNLASRSYVGDLLDAGVEVYRFTGGLLHTKAVLVDDAVTLFGTVNLDQRSFWLNFELTMMVFDYDFNSKMRALVTRYQRESERPTAAEWAARPIHTRFLENVAALFSPML